MQSASPRPLVVLESVPQLRSTTNPYLHQLVDSLRPHVQVELFSWRRALRGHYDVFHVHWPELLSRGASRPKQWGKQVLTWLFQARLRRKRTAVVRTAHNVQPHEAGSRIERHLLRRWDRLTTAWVALNADTPLPAGALSAVIPHGHYTDFYADLPHAHPTPHQLAAIGQIRGYKGTDDLVRVFRDIDDPDARLVIAGAVRTDDLRAELMGAARGDERILLELGFVADERLVEVVTSSSLIVLPYTAMHNSGVLLLALSLARPVLAPRNPVTDALAEEVGEEWVHRFDAPLKKEDIVAALAAGIPDGRPDLSAREWPDAGTAHLAIFEEAVNRLSHKERARA